MSLTETTPPPLNKMVITETGISEANITIKSLSIRNQPDGTKTIFVQSKKDEILFTLTHKECIHLAVLLINK